jgi:hypothetical protein
MIRFAALVTFFPVLVGAAPAYPKRAHAPLFFERNLGQSPPTALFLARTKNYTLELTTNALRVRIPGPAQNLAAIIYFNGALQSSTIEPLDQLSTQVNYYRGDPRTWLTGVPCWSRVRVRNIYTGIDLVFHGNDDALEFDFELAAGADPAQIKMKVDGSIASTLERDGSLLLAQREFGYRCTSREPIKWMVDYRSQSPRSSRCVAEPSPFTSTKGIAICRW